MVAHMNRRTIFLIVAFAFISISLLSLQAGLHKDVMNHIHAPSKPAPIAEPPVPAPPRQPVYKPTPTPEPPIVDNFPLAASARSATDIPSVSSWNMSPTPHVREKTPLLIGFTRNWRLLQQTIVSYITAGWPPSDIYVVENTGTMISNARGLLTLQNPFYLDYARLTNIFGVNVMATPILLSFSQLQNFYIHIAIERGWDYYFWSHMDVVALSEEDWASPDGGYRSLYTRCVDDLRQTLASFPARPHSLKTKSTDNDDKEQNTWAIRFYAYDRLALVNRHAFEAVGGWDPQIGYYGTDCDMHERLAMSGFAMGDATTGLVYDIGDSLDDLSVLYRRKPKSETGTVTDTGDSSAAHRPEAAAVHEPTDDEEDDRGSAAYVHLRDQLNSMQMDKNTGTNQRNRWQSRQRGGQGEPFYRDAEGFDRALGMAIEAGKAVMREKWGHDGCDLRRVGLGLGDAWRVVPEWELEGEGEER
ncbi:hypothetical protein B0A49_05708 [Cryomyces minteri]|uniref:Uncharacterized protein n=1 Tax=Cryomyces minteri TaxID=331657 RepID=A0A4U0XGV0_9PEZI|nr:hypothetical protein B0A49_05708 [Cryomyces minteri]